MKVVIQDEHLGVLAEQKELLGKQRFPSEVVTMYKRRLIEISAAKNVQDLRARKALHFEKLKEPRYKGKYSIRLNKAYRLILSIDKDEMNIEIIIIEEINNHYD